MPDDTAYWFRLGNRYARTDEPESAVRTYRAALQRNPHLAPAWHNLGSVLLEQAQAATVAPPGDPLQARGQQQLVCRRQKRRNIEMGKIICLRRSARKLTTLLIGGIVAATACAALPGPAVPVVWYSDLVFGPLGLVAPIRELSKWRAIVDNPWGDQDSAYVMNGHTSVNSCQQLFVANAMH